MGLYKSGTLDTSSLYCNCRALIPLLIFVILLETCICTKETVTLLQNEDGEFDIGIEGPESNSQRNKHRQTRGTPLSATGAVALRKLLSGAKPMFNGGQKYRNYHKEGGLVAALKDFYSVDPISVLAKSNKKGALVLKGRVGDRKLSLVSPGYMGTTILDIIDYTAKGCGDRYCDRIIYKKP